MLKSFKRLPQLPWGPRNILNVLREMISPPGLILKKFKRLPQLLWGPGNILNVVREMISPPGVRLKYFKRFPQRRVHFLSPVRRAPQKYPQPGPRGGTEKPSKNHEKFIIIFSEGYIFFKNIYFLSITRLRKRLQYPILVVLLRCREFQNLAAT